jgi:OFA family oxalate/formate antiporter-like MFS transporter
MATTTFPRSRWWLVAVAALLMGVAGSYQFLWSSLRGPLGASVGASEPALGAVFTLFVVTLTVSQFPAGWVRDRWGPRLPLLVGAGLLALGFLGASRATSPTELAVFYMIGGVGAGAGYTVAVNTPVKWFDERQGLATGVVVMAFGGLSFLLIPTVRSNVGSNLDGTLLGLGLLAGLVALAAAVLLRDPGPTGEDGAPEEGSTGSNPDFDTAYTWRETVRTWQFWLLYAVFIVINGIGVMVIGKAVAFAQALELTAAVATGSASLIAISDAAGVFVGSSASDRYGRERTAGAALGLTGIGLAGAVAAGAMGSGIAFVILLGVAAFFRSPAFAIFPVLVGEYYGQRHSSTNYAALYTAKIWGALFGGAVASTLVIGLGWTATFSLAAGVAVIAGVATFLLRPP